MNHFRITIKVKEKPKKKSNRQVCFTLLRDVPSIKNVKFILCIVNIYLNLSEEVVYNNETSPFFQTIKIKLYY